MAFLSNEVFDQGLDWVIATAGAAGRIDICVTEPTTYGQATTKDTHSLGYKLGLTVGATEDADSSTGRQVAIPAITDGTVDCTGTQEAGFWALTDNSSVLIATGAITTPQNVTDTNEFTLDEILITIRDAT